MSGAGHEAIAKADGVAYACDFEQLLNTMNRIGIQFIVENVKESIDFYSKKVRLQYRLDW
ncbi:hypothetical protein MTsPCn9_17800 [Croceitalea sp. MTPC9]|nr:hypothetical protein MTsPCn6_10650 [Croceitalea sp. MTPC6]GMN16844.1 hypothetical protein MTsPCn9_17800 [Croceitalea sp. MTPC9]